MFFEYIDGNSLAILGAAIAALASQVRRLRLLLRKTRKNSVKQSFCRHSRARRVFTV